MSSENNCFMITYHFQTHLEQSNNGLLLGDSEVPLDPKGESDNTTRGNLQ
jgi:hypothetical protein